ncbi:MAG: hypothetical protein AB1640_19835 [bacterium]
MTRPETAVFRVARSAILDPGGAIKGTDTARAQSLIWEAAEIQSPPERLAFFREKGIKIIADYSTADSGNRHLLLIDRELEIESAPYDGRGIEGTPQGKGHADFLKRASLSNEYESAVTGFHRGDGSRAIALRNSDLTLRDRAHSELLERERAPLVLVAESLNGRPEDITLVHIADLKGRTQYSTYVHPERSFPVRDEARGGFTPEYLGRPGWDILAAAPSRNEILPEIKAFLDSGSTVLIPTRSGPEASLIQAVRQREHAPAAVPEFRNTPLERAASEYAREMVRARTRDTVVVLDHPERLGSLTENARRQIRNAEFLSVHERAAVYGEIYTEMQAQALRSGPNHELLNSGPERHALLPYPEPQTEKAPRPLHTLRVFQRLPEAANGPIDLARFGEQYRETLTARGHMDHDMLLNLTRYEAWWEKIVPETGVALADGSLPRTAQAGDIIVEVGQEKSANRAFVVDRLGRPREVETVPITKGTIPNLSYNPTEGAPNWVAAVRPHPEQPGLLMRTPEVVTRSGNRVTADAFFLDTAEGGRFASAEKIRPGHILEFGGDELAGGESFKNRTYRLVLGNTQDRLLVAEISRDEAASPLQAFEHVNPRHVFEAYLVSADGSRRYPGRESEPEKRIPDRIPPSFRPTAEVTLALDRKVHVNDKAVLVLMDTDKILDPHNQIGGEAPERLRIHRVHASEIAASLKTAREQGAPDSALSSLRAQALKERGYVGEIGFAVTKNAEVATVLHVPDASRVRIIQTGKALAEDRIPKNISAEASRDNFLASFYSLEERTALGAGLNAMAQAGRVAGAVRDQRAQELSTVPEARTAEPPPLTRLERTVLEYKSLPETRAGAMAPEAAKLILDQVRDAKAEEARSVVNKEIQWREDRQAERVQDKQISRRQWELGL